MKQAKRAGKRVGVLSNDAYSINDPEFFAARPEFSDLDAFVDSTDVGVRKPAARRRTSPPPRHWVSSPLPSSSSTTLPSASKEPAPSACSASTSIRRRRSPAFERAAEVLGLVPESRARRLVRMAEEAYRAHDLDAIMALFHPDAIVRWNGRKSGSGSDEMRRFHVERLGFGSTTARATTSSRRRCGPRRATRSRSSGRRAIDADGEPGGTCRRGLDPAR